MYAYQGAVGLKIILNVGADVSSATTKHIKYLKPDGTIGYWEAEEESITSISYTTTSSSDLDIKGLWRLQAYVVTPTWENYGEICELLIESGL
jgi:hypothetical protein